MKIQRFWIEIIVLATAVACMLALLIAALGAAAAATEKLKEQQTFQGVVTCSRCGARHAAEMGKSAAECARLCVHSGATFALADGDSLYLLQGDADALRRVAGQRTSIVGISDGKTIRVSSVAAAR